MQHYNNIPTLLKQHPNWVTWGICDAPLKAPFNPTSLLSGRPTGITQNVEYLLDSVTARTMLSNSEFIVMNNQSASDRAELAKLLNISEEQLSYVDNAQAGCGLMRIGSAIVPFENRFNPNTALYRLMTTKPSER